MPDQQAPLPARPHVSAEQVADLLEGLVPADAQAATVAAHLDACAECARMRDDLQALPALLAATPAPPMPADVAARLDAALAEAGAQRDRVPSPATVTRLDSRRRRFVTRTFAGVAAAAALVVGIAVVGDVTGPGAGEDDSATNADSELDVTGGGAAEQQLVAGDLVRLERRDFRADARTALLAPTSAATDRQQSDAARRGNSGITCSAGDLRAAGVAGRPGPAALLDRTPVRLVASGPRQHSLVVAYSCESGAPVEQDRAYVDLSR